MTSEEHDRAGDLARLLKVIADESRLRILGLLADGHLVGKEIAARLDLSPPTVSHRMRTLVDAGIVTAPSEPCSAPCSAPPSQAPGINILPARTPGARGR